MARSKRRGNANGAGGTSSKTYRLDKKPVAVVMLALSLVIIIYALTYTNFDIIHGRGASAIIFASFAGSGFVLFMAPNTRGGNIKRFVKSYIAAGILGELGYFALPYLGIYITTALIIPATALVLEGTDSVHAPAISLAFAFIIYDVGLDGIVLVATAMVILIVVRMFLERAAFVVEREVVRGVAKVRRAL